MASMAGSVDRIAAQAGFGTATSLRQHLHATLGVSPGLYRTTFRGPAAPAHAGLHGREVAAGLASFMSTDQRRNSASS